jgi:hypothetical protein
MMFRRNVTVYSENKMKVINKVYGLHFGLLSVMTGGTCNYCRYVKNYFESEIMFCLQVQSL